MIRKLIFLIFVSLLFNPALAAVTLSQPERILSFDSIINVNPDASIDVAETISVYANKQQIEHGIVRRLPLRMQNGHGLSTAEYQIRSVLQNSASVSFFTQRDDYQLRIFIGDKKNVLTPGVYTYVLHYRVPNAVNFTKHSNQLNWNVTGNNWEFPILKASVMVNLPQHARILKEIAYAGTIGSPLKNYKHSLLTPNQILFTTIKPLEPGEAFTVALNWPQGFVYAAKAHEIGHASTGGGYALLIKMLVAAAITMTLYYLITRQYTRQKANERSTWWD